jgi:RHS repeat-associated protein
VMSFAILAVLLARPLLAGDSMATYEVTLTATGASSGVKAAARGVAAAYGATVEPGEINEERRTFVLRMKPESAALMRGDPRIQSARPLKSRAHVSTILPPMDLGVYLYDGAGNIESIGNDQFRYDEAGRLKSATVNGSANQQTFTYDAFGNRKDAARAASASVCIGNTQCEMSAPVEATNTNHLTAATYDDAGNVTVLDGTYNYSYDALNMVKSSTGGREYVYTADDERIATVSGGGWTWTIRSPSQQVLSEFTSSGTNWTWTRDHIWRGASLLAVEERNASGQTVTRHFHLDHLGTPRLITNGTGQQIGLHAYYPFGTELLSSTTETPPDNIKFTGHEWDDLGGDIHALTYMHARYYSGALGRFLSVDPDVAADAPKQPQHWNRYAYAFNGPLTHTDPSGRTVYDQLSATDSATLLSELRDKTGLDLYDDSNHVLQSRGVLKDRNGNARGSATARADLLTAMAPGSTHIIQSDTNVWLGKNAGAVTKLNFSDIAQINTGRNDPRTFDAASIVIHEMLGHGVRGLNDFPGSRTNNAEFLRRIPTWKGDVVDYDNKIRQELGLPTRSQYRPEQEEAGQKRTYIPFQNGPVYLPPDHQ